MTEPGTTATALSSPRPAGLWAAHPTGAALVEGRDDIAYELADVYQVDQMDLAARWPQPPASIGR